MSGSEHAKVELQLAARDANTRKLAAQLGKRPKWVVKDLSTGRHLTTVTNHILRNLSLDGGHQVILFPDTTVHTHLKSTAISWGPNIDPTAQLLDVYKILGCPSRMHLLFHVIAPEAFSPAGKSPPRRAMLDQEQQQDQHTLQPRQLAYVAVDQLQQGLLQADQQRLQLHNSMQQLTQSSQQAPSVQQEHSISAAQPGASAAAPAWATAGQQQQQQQQGSMQEGGTPLSAAAPQPRHVQQDQLGQHIHRQQQQQQQEQLARLYGDLQLLPGLQPLAGHLQQQQPGWGMPPASLQQLILQQPSLPVMSQQQQQHCQQLLLAQQQQQQYLQRLAHLHHMASSAGLAWPGYSAGLPGMLSMSEGLCGLFPGSGVNMALGLQGAPPAAAAAAASAELPHSWLQQQQAAHLANQHQQQPERSSHSQQSVPQGSRGGELGGGNAGVSQPVAAVGGAGVSGGVLQTTGSQLDAQQQLAAQGWQLPPAAQQSRPDGLPGAVPQPRELQEQQQHPVPAQHQQPSSQPCAQAALPASTSVISDAEAAAAAAAGSLAQELQRSVPVGPASPSCGLPEVSLSASAGGPTPSVPTAAAARQQAAEEQRQQARLGELTHSAAQRLAVQDPQQAEPTALAVQQQQQVVVEAAVQDAAPVAAPAVAAATVVWVKGADGSMMELSAVLENGRFILQLPQAPIAPQAQPLQTHQQQGHQQQQPGPQARAQLSTQQQQQQQQQHPASLTVPVQSALDASVVDQQALVQPISTEVPMQEQARQQQQQQQALLPPAGIAACAVLTLETQGGGLVLAEGLNNVQQQSAHMLPPANPFVQPQQQQHGRDDLRVAALLAQQQQRQQQQVMTQDQLCGSLQGMAAAPGGFSVPPLTGKAAAAAAAAHAGLKLQVPNAALGGFTASPAASPALDAVEEEGLAAGAASTAAAAAAAGDGGEVKADTPDAGALRSHCSSVSCGGPATGSGPSSKYRQPQQHQHAIDIAGVGGSATRSGLRVQSRPEASGAASDAVGAELVHSQQEKPQRSSSSISRDSLRGRGILQPRQLQLQDAPSTSSGQRRQQQSVSQQQQSKLQPPQQQQQQGCTVSGQWQPQLQCISEEHTPSAAHQQDGATGPQRVAGSAHNGTPGSTPMSCAQTGGTAALGSARADISQSAGLRLELSDMEGPQLTAAAAAGPDGVAATPTNLAAAAGAGSAPAQTDALEAHLAAEAVAVAAVAAGAAAVGAADGSPAADVAGKPHSQVRGAHASAAGTMGGDAAADAQHGEGGAADAPAPAAAAPAGQASGAVNSPQKDVQSDAPAATDAADADADPGADAAGDYGYGDDGDGGYEFEDMPSPGDAQAPMPAPLSGTNAAAVDQRTGVQAKQLQQQDKERHQQQSQPGHQELDAAAATGPGQQQVLDMQLHQGCNEQQHSSGPTGSHQHQQQQPQQTSSKRSYSDAQGSAAPAVDPAAARSEDLRQPQGPAAQRQQRHVPAAAVAAAAAAAAAAAGDPAAAAFPAPAPPAKRSKRDSTRSSSTQAALAADEDKAVGVPTIVCQGRTAVGTWHISTGGWDSRPDETPLTHQDYTGGSIYSVSQLLQQQELEQTRQALQQQQRRSSAGAAGVDSGTAAAAGTVLRGVSNRVGIRRGPVPAGSLPRAGIRKGPPRAGYRGPPGPAALSQLQLLQQQQQQQLLGRPYQLPSSMPGMGRGGDDLLMQQLDYAEARVAAAAAMAGGMVVQTAAAAAPGGMPCLSDREPRPASSTGTGQSLSLVQRHAPTGSQTTTRAEPQQQQQLLPQGPPSGQWDGFQLPAAAAAAASGSTDSQGRSPANPQRQDRAGSVEAGTGPQGTVQQHQPHGGLDYASLQAILQSNSVLALEEQYLQQQQQQGAGAAGGTSGQGINMHDALSAAGVLPTARQGAAAAAAEVTGQQCSSGSSGQEGGAGGGRKKLVRASRAPLPAPAALQAQGTAAGGLQRYPLPNGQVVYVAAQPAPLPASQPLQQLMPQPGALQQQGSPAAAAAGKDAPGLQQPPAAGAAAMHGPPTAAQLAAAVNSLAASQPVDSVAPTPVHQKLMVGGAGGSSLWGGVSSGFQTPAMLSPNAAMAAAAIKGMTTVDCMEALLNDKDFALPSAFNTPDKGGAWLNGGSLLSTPAGLLLSPMPPPPKRQRQQAGAAGTGQPGAQQPPGPGQQHNSADFQAMYQAFRDAAAGPAASEPAAAASGVAAAAASTAGPHSAPAAAHTGTAAASGAAAGAAGGTPVVDRHADDTHGVGDLCDFILDPSRGDSWLMPPPAAAAAAAGAAVPPAAAAVAGRVPAALAPPADAVAAAAGGSGSKPKRQPKGGAGQGRRTAAAGAARQRTPAAAAGRQQQAGAQQPQQAAAAGEAADGSEPNRVWAQLFKEKQ